MIRYDYDTQTWKYSADYVDNDAWHYDMSSDEFVHTQSKERISSCDIDRTSTTMFSNPVVSSNTVKMEHLSVGDNWSVVQPTQDPLSCYIGGKNINSFLGKISKLTKQLDEAKPHINELIAISEEHGYSYNGPNMTDLLQEIKKELAEFAKYIEIKE